MRALKFQILLALPLALSLFAPLAVAADVAAGSASAQALTTQSIDAMMQALNKARSAVVGVRVKATEGARSAETLGEARAGSGVVIGADGLILTIGYLMLEAQQIDIITPDNKTWPATAVAYDIATGFGLIRPLLPLRGISPVVLGSLQDLNPGEALLAATGANGRGDSGGVSMTELISRRAFSGTWEYHIDTALFTSPPVASSRGNHSGAPLFNVKGELLGIGSLLVMDATGENRRMPGNMFVPVELLKPILAELQQSGSSSQSHRPWLGLTSSDRGGQVQIVRVNADSPAEAAGLEPGHMVLAVDGVEVSTLEAFYKKLWARASPNDTVRLTVRQGDETKTLEIRPEDRLLMLKKPTGI